MKVLVFVKATANSEKGIFPPDAEKLFAEMGKFNEQLVRAGIMTDGDGLKPSSAGKRILFSGPGEPSVIDGPFAETKELVAGFWVWNVKSMDEAVEWAKRCPNPMPGEEGVLEIRPTYAAEDFGEFLTDEQREQEQRLRKEAARRPKSKATAKSASKANAKSKGKSTSRPPARAKSAPRPAKRVAARARSKK
jgi:hypothetical protein